MTMPEIHGAHKCACARNWEGIEFKSAKLQPDGSLELTHDCPDHKNEWCVHVVNAQTAGLIREALQRTAPQRHSGQ